MSMLGPYRIFWGDTHHNSYMGYRQDPPLAEVLQFASRHLDFYTGAYYTPVFTNAPVKADFQGAAGGTKDGHPVEQADFGTWRGIGLEGHKDPVKMAAEWREFQEVTAAWNRPGTFVAFPGYEWQGNGRWGDHNVVYTQEGQPIATAETLAELYAFLRGRDAIAIPHHTGYQAGLRAPQWAACDETLTPFQEIYSCHGCSETDEEWVGLRNNTHMGPGFTGATWQDALNAGLHLGCICSTDNWANMPGQWNQGLAACLAKDLSRASLFAAFRARRVYGVTGDRIELDFTLNGQDMGSILDYSPRRELVVSVRGCEALDRIEILRQDRVIATHCHQGTWQQPRPGTRARFKFRVEVGWGSRPGELPLADHDWQGRVHVEGGRVLGWSPCWIARGQQAPEISGDQAAFRMHTSQSQATLGRYSADVFEIEADPGAPLTVGLDDVEVRDSVESLSRANRLLWFRDDCVRRVEKYTGITPQTARRGDCYYHHAWKAKLHKVIPEAAYTATFSISDDEPMTAACHYRVRVEQRNGQRAWSSPIWVQAKP